MQSNQNKGTICKVIAVGDSGVGKTSLYSRFVHNEFHPKSVCVGIDFFIKPVEINEKPIRLQLWDFVGQSRFRSHTIAYFKNAKIVLLVFDLSNKDSFQSIKNYWMSEVDKYCDSSKIVAIVGTKCDIKTMDSTEVSEFAIKNNYHYFETSSKESINVNEMFMRVSELAVKLLPSELGAKVETPIPLNRSAPANSWDGFCRTC